MAPADRQFPADDHPCLDIFMRALPFTLRPARANEGTVVAGTVTGKRAGVGTTRSGAGWAQVPAGPRSATATVTMDQDTGWKLVTKRRSREVIRTLFPDDTIMGDEVLGLHVLDTVSVMA